jgi:hypothetical protein
MSRLARLLLALALTASAAALVGPARGDSGATVYKGGDRPGVECVVAGSISGGPQLATFNFTEVITSHTYALTCQFEYPAGFEPAAAFEVIGANCGTPFGTTFDTRFVATPSGHATLTCLFVGSRE